MSVVRTVLFMVVATLVVGGLHALVYWGLVRRTTAPGLARRVAAVLLSVAAASTVAGPLLSARLPSPWRGVFSLGVWVWFGVLIYLGMLLAAGLGLVWAGQRAAERRARRRGELFEVDASRRLFLSRAVASASLVGSGTFLGLGASSAFGEPRVTRLAVPLPGLPKALDGFTIVHLSDIHVGGMVGEGFVRPLVGRVDALKPDLVAITGDLVDGSVRNLGPTVALLGQLRAAHGVHFVTGNHEYYSGDESWCEALPKMGINVLRNRGVRIGDAGASFDLLGVDDWSQRNSRRGYDLTQALADTTPDRAKVLLAHQPMNFDQAAKRGVGLQLSGHTHGGQFFPGTLMVSLFMPWVAGHFREGDGHLYVSRGTGFWGPPFRVGSPPEIVVVTLTA